MVVILLATAWAGLGGNFFYGCWEEVGTAYAEFSSNFSASVITSFNVGSAKADYYAFTKPFRRGFKLYTNACMASSFPSSGNATTTLSKALMYSYTEPHC